MKNWQQVNPALHGFLYTKPNTAHNKQKKNGGPRILIQLCVKKHKNCVNYFTKVTAIEII